MLRPNFDEPLDTAKQLVKKNIIVFDGPGSEFWGQFLLESSVPEYNILGETFFCVDDWDTYNDMFLHDILGAGTHAVMLGYLNPEEIALGRWYRSKEKLDGMNPFAGYLTNKKWHLNEVISFKQCLID